MKPRPPVPLTIPLILFGTITGGSSAALECPPRRARSGRGARPAPGGGRAPRGDPRRAARRRAGRAAPCGRSTPRRNEPPRPNALKGGGCGGRTAREGTLLRQPRPGCRDGASVAVDVGHEVRDAHARVGRAEDRVCRGPRRADVLGPDTDVTEESGPASLTEARRTESGPGRRRRSALRTSVPTLPPPVRLRRRGFRRRGVAERRPAGDEAAPRAKVSTQRRSMGDASWSPRMPTCGDRGAGRIGRGRERVTGDEGHRDGPRG